MKTEYLKSDSKFVFLGGMFYDGQEAEIGAMECDQGIRAKSECTAETDECFVFGRFPIRLQKSGYKNSRILTYGYCRS